jgi:hypothetical protein
MPFTGKLVVITKGKQVHDKSLVEIGWLSAPDNYPNGTLILEETGLEPTWETYVWPDPCAGISDDDVSKSATHRRLK